MSLKVGLSYWTRMRSDFFAAASRCMCECSIRLYSSPPSSVWANLHLSWYGCLWKLNTLLRTLVIFFKVRSHYLCLVSYPVSVCSCVCKVCVCVWMNERVCAGQKESEVEKRTEQEEGFALWIRLLSCLITPASIFNFFLSMWMEPFILGLILHSWPKSSDVPNPHQSMLLFCSCSQVT